MRKVNEGKMIQWLNFRYVNGASLRERLNSAAENLKFGGRKHEEPWKQSRSIGQHIHGQWMLPSLMHSFVGQSSIRELCPPAVSRDGKKPFETGLDTHTHTTTIHNRYM